MIAGLQEKIIYKLVLFPSGSSRTKDVLQKKATRGATNKVIKETAGWIQQVLTFGTLISAFTKPSLYSGSLLSLYGGGLPFLYSGGPFFLYSRDSKRSRRNSR